MKKLLLGFELLTAYSGNAQIENYSVGQTVANFTLTDIHGTTHTLYNYTAAGKYLLLDFYAYWCGPCCSTAPIIKDFYTKYGCNEGDVVVIGLEYEGTTAQTETFETNCLATTTSYPACAGIDGGAAAVHTTYGPAAFPTVCLISPSNSILNLDIWPISSVASIEAAFPGGALTLMACATSIEDVFTESTVAVYPNPAVDYLSLAINLNSIEDLSYTIYDVVGNKISSSKLGLTSMLNTQVDVSSLANGAYVLHLQAGDKATKAYHFTVAH